LADRKPLIIPIEVVVFIRELDLFGFGLLFNLQLPLVVCQQHPLVLLSSKLFVLRDYFLEALVVFAVVLADELVQADIFGGAVPAVIISWAWLLFS